MKTLVRALLLFALFGSFIPGQAFAEDYQKEIVRRAKKIARAMKNYADDHNGQLPGSVSLLVPKYLSQPDTWLQVPGTRPGIQMVIPRVPIRDLSDPPSGARIIAFQSTPDKEGRLIITQDFKVWGAGEFAFQRILAGEPEIAVVLPDKVIPPQPVSPPER